MHQFLPLNFHLHNRSGGDQNPRPRQNANQGPRPRDAALRQRHIDEIQKAVGQRLEPKKKQVEEPEKMANVTCFNCT
jgi:hypothetical protein